MPDFPDIPASLTDELIAELLSAAAERKTTDLHFEKGRLFYRAQGKLQPAKNWRSMVDDHERVAPMFTIGNLREKLMSNTAVKSAGDAPTTASTDLTATNHHRTVMYRLPDLQVRVQLLENEGGDKLIVRVQDRHPPAFEAILPKALEARQFLVERPEGLVLVTGPLGSGKTTIASSIAAAWASKNRHLVTLEDPVEYILASNTGSVSHLPCNFRDHVMLESRIESILRSDMDALFVGEVRSSEALQTCFEFAGMREPVITTAHGGSIAHALIRLMNIAGRSDGMSEASCKRSLAQCLHAVVYINLAFTERGSPVPVVMSLPGTHKAVRKIIAEDDANLFSQKIDTFMKESGKMPGVINYEQAMSQAINAGATRESVIAALPPQGDEKPA